MLNVIMLSVVMLSVIILNVVMLCRGVSPEAPFDKILQFFSNETACFLIAIDYGGCDCKGITIYVATNVILQKML